MVIDSIDLLFQTFLDLQSFRDSVFFFFMCIHHSLRFCISCRFPLPSLTCLGRKGLEPALWRQATYGSMRYGFYTPIKELLAPGVEKQDLHLGHKITAGALSGALSSAICNPADLVKVRMMADGMKSGATAGGGGMAAGVQTAKYRWFWPSMFQIARQEGILGLWQGTGPTCARATALAAAELATYDHIKQTILDQGWMDEGESTFEIAKREREEEKKRKKEQTQKKCS